MLTQLILKICYIIYGGGNGPFKFFKINFLCQLYNVVSSYEFSSILTFLKGDVSHLTV